MASFPPVRLGALLGVGLGLTFCVYLFYDNGMRGFPDGHLTALDEAMRIANLAVGGLTLLVVVRLGRIVTIGDGARQLSVLMLMLVGIVAFYAVGMAPMLVEVFDLDVGGGG